MSDPRKASAADVAVEVLCEFLKADPIACQGLFSHRVEVSPDVVDHPTIIVKKSKGRHTMGAIGLLNGIMERACGERLALVMDEDELVGFQKYNPPAKKAELPAK